MRPETLRMRTYMPGYRARKRALGLCWNCTARAIPGRARCEACAERHRNERHAAR